MRTNRNKVIALAAAVAAIIAGVFALTPGPQPHFGFPHHGGEIPTGAALTFTGTNGPHMKPAIAAVGEPLTLSSKGTWNEVPTTFTYQWERCHATGGNSENAIACVPEIGATSITYTPKAGDAGYSMRCKVGARRNGSFGYGYTGYTIGVEPKYGRFYPASNFWNQRLPESGSTITEQSRYARGLEESFLVRGAPRIQATANSNPIYFIPPAEPTETALFEAKKEFKLELASVLTNIRIPPWATPGQGNLTGGGTPDRPFNTWTVPGNGESAHELDSSASFSKPGYEVTSATKNGETEIHLTSAQEGAELTQPGYLAGGAAAKGFVPGARIIWNATTSNIVKPQQVATIYFVISSSETGFTFSRTPRNLGGTAEAVETTAGAEIKREAATEVALVSKRKFGAAGVLANPEIYTQGVYEPGEESGGEWLPKGAAHPSPANKEMWRWGSPAGSRPGIAGIITYEDWRKVQATTKENEDPIEHVIGGSDGVRKERLVGAPNAGKAKGLSEACVPGSCWTDAYKGDGEAKLTSIQPTAHGTGKLEGTTTIKEATEEWVVGDGITAATGIPAEDTVTAVVKVGVGNYTLTLSKAATETKAGVTLNKSWGCYNVLDGEGHHCLIPREGMHWRLKHSTVCGTKEGGGAATKMARGLCEALRDYGMVFTDKSTSTPGAEFQFLGEENVLANDGTAFTTVAQFDPYKEAPGNFYEGKSAEAGGSSIAKEVPLKGNVEVMAGVEYCGGVGENAVTKEVKGGGEESKINAAKVEEETGCKRPTEIE